MLIISVRKKFEIWGFRHLGSGNWEAVCVCIYIGMYIMYVYIV